MWRFRILFLMLSILFVKVFSLHDQEGFILIESIISNSESDYEIESSMSRETINDPRIMNHKKISSINTQIETTGFVQLSSYSTDNCNGVPEIYSWRLGSCHPNGENSISYSQIHIDDHHETVSLLELKYSDHKCLHYLSERFINVTSGCIPPLIGSDINSYHLTHNSEFPQFVVDGILEKRLNSTAGCSYVDMDNYTALCPFVDFFYYVPTDKCLTFTNSSGLRYYNEYTSCRNSYVNHTEFYGNAIDYGQTQYKEGNCSVPLFTGVNSDGFVDHYVENIFIYNSCNGTYRDLMVNHSIVHGECIEGDYTSSPSSRPSSIPSYQPTSQPTYFPTVQPTSYPTSVPTSLPSSMPSSQPSVQPSSSPSSSPTILSVLTFSSSLLNNFNSCQVVLDNETLTVRDGQANEQYYFCAIYTASECSKSTVSSYSCQPSCLEKYPGTFCNVFAQLSQTCLGTYTISLNLINVTVEETVYTSCVTNLALSLSSLTSVMIIATFNMGNVSFTAIENDGNSQRAIRYALMHCINGVEDVSLAFSTQSLVGITKLASDHSSLRKFHVLADTDLIITANITSAVEILKQPAGSVVSTTEYYDAFTTMNNELKESFQSADFLYYLNLACDQMKCPALASFLSTDSNSFASSLVIESLIHQPTTAPTVAPIVVQNFASNSDDDPVNTPPVISAIVIGGCLVLILFVIVVYRYQEKKKEKNKVMDESRINQINNNNNNNHNNTNNVNNINNAAANRNIESDPVKIQPVAKTPTAHEPPPMLSDQNSAESSGRQNKSSSQHVPPLELEKIRSRKSPNPIEMKVSSKQKQAKDNEVRDADAVATVPIVGANQKNNNDQDKSKQTDKEDQIQNVTPVQQQSQQVEQQQVKKPPEKSQQPTQLQQESHQKEDQQKPPLQPQQSPPPAEQQQKPSQQQEKVREQAEPQQQEMQLQDFTDEELAVMMPVDVKHSQKTQQTKNDYALVSTIDHDADDQHKKEKKDEIKPEEAALILEDVGDYDTVDQDIIIVSKQTKTVSEKIEQRAPKKIDEGVKGSSDNAKTDKTDKMKEKPKSTEANVDTIKKSKISDGGAEKEGGKIQKEPTNDGGLSKAKGPEAPIVRKDERNNNDQPEELEPKESQIDDVKTEIEAIPMKPSDPDDLLVQSDDTVTSPNDVNHNPSIEAPEQMPPELIITEPKAKAYDASNNVSDEEAHVTSSKTHDKAKLAEAPKPNVTEQPSELTETPNANVTDQPSDVSKTASAQTKPQPPKTSKPSDYKPTVRPVGRTASTKGEEMNDEPKNASNTGLRPNPPSAGRPNPRPQPPSGAKPTSPRALQAKPSDLNSRINPRRNSDDVKEDEDETRPSAIIKSTKP